MPALEKPKKTLLVEGEDDEHVVERLRSRFPSIPEFEIKSKDGLSELLKSISAELKISGQQVVGIVVDADDDFLKCWNDVAVKLKEAGFDPPDQPDPEGTVIPTTPRIGVWIMPDNRSIGELEDFVKRMIPTDDPVWPLSTKYIENIPCKGRKFAKGKTLKAELHAWLATRRIPGRMGAAIRAGDLNVDGPNCRAFVAWLQKLFGG